MHFRGLLPVLLITINAPAVHGQEQLLHCTSKRAGVWATLRVVATGDLFGDYYNGRKLYEVKDITFTEAGRAGVWTKADSYTLFDDLSITLLK